MYEIMLFNSNNECVIVRTGYTVAEALHAARQAHVKSSERTPDQTVKLYGASRLETPNDVKALTDGDRVVEDAAPIRILWAYGQLTMPVGLIRRID